jgi:hypothetical protein
VSTLEPREPPAHPTCPWCSAHVAADARTCPACGAGLVAPAALADLVIPGLNAIDPALVVFDRQPFHLHGPSPTHAAIGSALGAAVVGPAGLVALAGVAALAASESRTSNRPPRRAITAESVGELPSYVEDALAREGFDLPEDSSTPAGELRKDPRSR